MEKEALLNNCIKVVGASQHNLKDISFNLPIGNITVITGVSGSGKSSLAFDTLYAEGQRRYIETFSPYARQFIERMDRPKVERIEGILPAIAIDQKNPVKTSRSTVGTMTEITDYVKLLFSQIARLYCERCNRVVTEDTPQSIWENIKDYSGKRAILTFPYKVEKPNLARQALIHLGFDRRVKDGEISYLEELDLEPDQEISILIDRFFIKEGEKKRILDSLEQAFKFGKGHVGVMIENGDLKFTDKLHCPYCDIAYKQTVPNLFSFNSPLGACEVCRGFGKIIDIDLDLVIPDKGKSLAEGAIKPWRQDTYEFSELIDFCHRYRIPVDIPFSKLRETHKKMIIEGHEDYYGIRRFFRWLETKSYKMHVRVFLSRYRGYFICPECKGTRFKKGALLYKIKGKNIAEIYAPSISSIYKFFEELEKDVEDNIAAKLIVDEINRRLRYLIDVGLGYLNLDRQSRTLSGGEVARVSLTRALGASLVNTLYVLDEPSIGLHPRDSHRLVNILKRLSGENTVVVVEHDPEIIKNCDYILDLGPGAGEAGGQIMYFGKIKGIKSATNSLTAGYLTGRLSIPVPKKYRMPNSWLYIKGAKAHNLKGIDINIPLGVMACLTGVSGSGKSTLAEEIIYKGIKKEKGQFIGRPGEYKSVKGLERIKDAIFVNQSAISGTPRANPATYLGCFGLIREIFSHTEQAKEHGYTAGTFSFNSPGGRCEACKGEGFEKIEMQFLSDVYLTCPKCQGKRYKPEILEVKYRGKNIADVLQMSFSEALSFFSNIDKICRCFQPIFAVGLEYLRLGQPINTLSSGEAQRLKLAKYMSIKDKGPYLFIFDEPTIGLHFADIQRLLGAFNELIEKGHSVLVIEHNLDVIKSADCIIDLGPEGGEAGGEIVAQGAPKEIAMIDNSHTGRYLKRYLINDYLL
ncbi:MAG: hypothetical protein AMJ45_01280 [Syntrophobacter sp. DG_60]|nr:MAG: hypothetical protein AMJ45_01280 [Syntrophobacter sp. DG_60]